MEKIKFILLTILLLFTIDVSASSISPFSIKNNNTTGYYDIKKYQQSDMSKIDTYGQVGSSYNVSYIQTLLNFNSNISSSSYYDLKINFTNSNFNASSIQDVKIVAYNTIPTSLNYNENLGTTLNLVYLKNNTSNTNTNSITIRFYNKLLTNYSYFQVFILQDYRVMNTGISSIDLTRVDDNQAIKDLQENQNTNRDLIINNITNSIDSSLNNCYANIIPDDNYINSSGEIVINGTYDSTQWLYLGIVSLNSGNYTLIANTGNSNITLVVDELRQYDTSTTKQFSLSSSISSKVYIRFESGTYNNVKFKPAIITGFTNNYIKPGEKSCTSKIDDTNDKLDDLNQNITSPNVPNRDELSAKLDTTGWLPPGPVDTIINIPLNLLNNLLSSLDDNSCSQLVIDIPFLENKQLIIPCISTIYDKMGASALFNSIGVVASAFILFRYLVGFYKWVDDTLTFREQNWGDF